MWSKQMKDFQFFFYRSARSHLATVPNGLIMSVGCLLSRYFNASVNVIKFNALQAPTSDMEKGALI